MKQVAATQMVSLLQKRNKLFETVRIERCGIKQEQRGLADDVACGEAGKDRVRFHGLQDLPRVVVKNKPYKFGQASGISRMRTEEHSGALAKGQMLWRGLAGKPMVFLKNQEHILRSEEILPGGMWLDVADRGHKGSLAHTAGQGGSHLKFSAYTEWSVATT